MPENPYLIHEYVKESRRVLKNLLKNPEDIVKSFWKFTVFHGPNWFSSWIDVRLFWKILYLPGVGQVDEVACILQEIIFHLTPLLSQGRVALLDHLAAGHVGSLLDLFGVLLQRFQLRLLTLKMTAIMAHS